MTRGIQLRYFGHMFKLLRSSRESNGGISSFLSGALQFSNEAGMGSAPNAAATATTRPNHPAAQGLAEEDTHVVYAEGLNLGEQQREAAIKEAFQAIDQLVEGL